MRMKLVKAVALAICLTMTAPVVAPSVGIETVEAATKVKLNCTKKTILKGERFNLKISGTNKKVKWSSSNKKVAEVHGGEVKGVGEGTAKITATVGGKKYTCKVTVKVTYGAVSGNITYHYNQYKGYVPNNGSVIYFFPVDKMMGYITDKKDIAGLKPSDLKYMTSSAKRTLQNLGIYATKVDGNGNFTISHVPHGDYFVLVVSGQTSTQGWFDAYDESISDATDSYYNMLANDATVLIGVEDELAMLIAKSIGFSAYSTDYLEVTVYENETSFVTYEFPYTYI